MSLLFPFSIRRNVQVYARKLMSAPRRSYKDDGAHEIQRTSLQVVAGSHHMPIVKSYSSQGFSIGDTKIIGPVAVLPRGFFLWKVKSKESITSKNLSLFPIFMPKIDILVIGTGHNIAIPHPEALKFLKSNGIAIEIQDTPNACATFNFLLEEGRQVAAALIPPIDETLNL